MWMIVFGSGHREMMEEMQSASINDTSTNSTSSSVPKGTEEQHDSSGNEEIVYKIKIMF